MVKFRLIGIESNNFPTIFKSSRLRIEQPGKTSTRQAKKYCINRHALAHQATCYHRHILSHSLARKVNGKVSHSNWVDEVVYEGVCTFHDILKLLQEPVEIRTIPVQGNL